MRHAALRVDLEAIVRLLGLPRNRRIRIVNDPVPYEARIVSFEVNTRTGICRFVLEADTFAEIAPGARIPDLRDPVIFEEIVE